jgi:hypothetical protein
LPVVTLRKILSKYPNVKLLAIIDGGGGVIKKISVKNTLTLGSKVIVLGLGSDILKLTNEF